MAGKALSRKTFIHGMFGAGLLGPGALLLAACERTANLGARKEIAVSLLLPGDLALKATVWKPLLDDMARQTGLRVKTIIAETYADQVEALHGNKVQFGLFSDLKGAEALTRGHGEVFAEAEGATPLQSLIVVPVDSKLTAAELTSCDKRLTFAIGEASSGSTGQVPLYGMFQLTKGDPRACFKTVTQGRPNEAVAGLLKGTINAAAIDSEILADLKQADLDTFAKIKVISSSEPLPEDVLICRRDLDPVTKEKLRSFFLSYGKAPGAEGERQRDILAALQLKGFNPEDNTHFIPIKRMQASLDLAEAERGTDPEAIEKARMALRKATAEQRMLDAKTAPQLPADAQSS